MQQVRLEVEKRSTFGKGNARALRRGGSIPAVLYGRREDVVPLRIDEHVFRTFLRKNSENVLIDLDIKGHGTETAMIREIQQHPVSKQTLLHADFVRVSLDEPVTAAVPIVLNGTPIGVRESDGVLEFPLRELSVHCLPALLPHEIQVDVNELDVNEIIHVGDLTVAEGIQVLDDSQTMVTAVSPPKVEEEVAAEEIEGEEMLEPEQEEPELITRKRSDDEDEE
jgi:large subunit ribosomal protein L25